ncbi:MAG: Gfo/Idh/MocA family protein [Myxococcaceae bacterium]
MGALFIGLVGCGHWGKFILRDLRELGAEVSVVARTGASAMRAEEGGAARIVSSIGALPKLDGLVVATSSVSHAQVLEEAHPLGVPTFVEKPLTCDIDSARHVVELYGARLMVMEKWRYHPGIEMLGSIARSGELGRVLGLKTERLQWGHRRTRDDPLWILAPHDVAIAKEVLGELPKPRAAVTQSVHGHPVSLSALCGVQPYFQFDVSLRFPSTRRSATLYCEEGIAVLDDAYAQHVSVIRSQGPDDVAKPHIERRPLSDEMPLKRQLAAFLAHVRGGPPPKSTAAEGLEGVELIVRLREMAGL